MTVTRAERLMWIPLHEHLQAIEVEREKFNAERDRRYTEVKNAEEKALKIKEEADKVALELARQIQTYKDQQHNGLLDQLTQERGKYATKADLTALTEKIDVTVKPLVEFMARSRGGTVVYGQLAIAIGLLLSAIALFVKL